MNLDENYWQNRYSKLDTPWDAGAITTPLKVYFDQLTDTTTKILIPGCGNAYEAEYLHNKKFTNVYIADIATAPLLKFKSNNPFFPVSHILHEDVFKLDETFDLIVEQTFLCALHPSERNKYARRMAKSLSKNGKLVGLLFDMPLSENGPPFGGNTLLYKSLLSPYFEEVSISECYNSIAPRAGKELFLIAQKPIKSLGYNVALISEALSKRYLHRKCPLIH